MKFILASQLPRRKEILSKLGNDFEIIPVQGEVIITSTKPYVVVNQQFLQKAKEVYDFLDTNEDQSLIVIGSDTVVS